MNRGQILREMVKMFRAGQLTVREFTHGINLLNKWCHPRFVHRMLQLGAL